MRRRRGIMGLNGGAGIPVITATATGNPLTFETDLERPLKSLVIPFTPIQAGTGNPSPTNVRPISGRTGANIYNEETYDASATPKLTINWQTEAGTIYGGTLTLNEDGSADVVHNRLFQTFDGSSDEDWSSGGYGTQVKLWLPTSIQNLIQLPKSGAYAIDAISNYLRAIAQNANWNNYDNMFSSTGNYYYMRCDTIGALANWRPYLAEHPLTICFKRKTPITYHFDNVGQLITFLGTNNIWTDTNGTNTATYLKHQI